MGCEPSTFMEVNTSSGGGGGEIEWSVAWAFAAQMLVTLRQHGLNQTLIKWIGSFLSDRSIAVRVDGFLSNLHSIDAGVPQGCVIITHYRKEKHHRGRQKIPGRRLAKGACHFQSNGIGDRSGQMLVKKQRWM